MIHLSIKIRVYQILADLIPIVGLLEILLLACVKQITLDLHQIVDQNVLSIPNVLVILPALMKSVETHVLVVVGSMQIVKFSITFQTVTAYKDMKETHSIVVVLNHPVRHY